MRSKLILLLLCFFPVFGMGQIVLEGRVADESGKSLENCVVVQLARKDSVVLATGMTDSLGLYKIYTSQWENTCLYVAYFSYLPVYQNVSGDGLMPEIRLQSAPLQLDEVMVKGEKPAFTRKGDRFIFKIPESFASKDAFEVLKYTPLLNITDKEFSIIGKEGTTVYLNGRRSHMPVEAIRMMLASLSAERIERVEIITQPGSENRADDVGGIINIVLKKNLPEVLTGRLTVGMSQSYYNGQNISTNLMYAQNKLNVSLGGYFNRWKNRQENGEEMHYFSTEQSVLNRDVGRKENYNGAMYLNMDYKINDKNTVAVNFYYSKNKDKTKTETTGQYYTRSQSQPDSIFTGVRTRKSPVDYFNAGIAYTLLTDTLGSKFDIDLNYDHSSTSVHNFNHFKRFARGQDYREKTDMMLQNYSALFSYLHVVDSKSNLMGGGEFYSTNSDHDYFYGYLQGNEYQRDTTKTNRYLFRDYLGALFVRYDLSNLRFSLSLGVRGEYYYRNGLQLMTNERMRSGQFNLFPFLAFGWDINRRHALSLSYRSGIQRPGYQQLNPFKKYINPALYEENNPTLLSMKQYSVELSYTLLQSYVFLCTYGYLKDPYAQFVLPVGENMAKQVQANFNHSQNINFTFSGRKNLFHDYLSLSASAVFMCVLPNGKVGNTEITDRQGMAQVNAMAMVKISKQHKLDCSVDYRYDSPPLFGEIADFDSNHALNITIQKQFGRSNLTLIMHDLLANDSRVDNTFASYRHSTFSKSYREVSIVYTYNFGNNSNRTARQVQKSSAVGRVKQ